MTLRDLFENGKVKLAVLPEYNDYLIGADGNIDFDKLDGLSGYAILLIAHDYGAKTPIMWNKLYEKLGLSIRSITIVGDPNDCEEILRNLKSDPKFLGGGGGVGFKEVMMPHLDKIVPEDLKSVNNIVKEGDNLVGYNTDAPGFVASLEESLSGVGKTIEGSNIVVYGAGGVVKEIVNLLAKKGVNCLIIINRTFSKAVLLANYLNERYGRSVAIGISEDLSRSILLNQEIKIDSLINLSDKGSDGKLVNVAMYVGAHDKNESFSKDILRELNLLRPDIVIADIVLPSSGKSISLRFAEEAGIKNLLDGKPMVINQAVDAYLRIQEAYPEKHIKKVTSDEVLRAFKEVAG